MALDAARGARREQAGEVGREGGRHWTGSNSGGDVLVYHGRHFD
jgi:hypothetical protein